MEYYSYNLNRKFCHSSFNSHSHSHEWEWLDITEKSSFIEWWFEIRLYPFIEWERLVMNENIPFIECEWLVVNDELQNFRFKLYEYYSMVSNLVAEKVKWGHFNIKLKSFLLTLVRTRLKVKFFKF